MPRWVDFLEFGEQFGIPPWQVEDGLDLVWWERWRLWRAAKAERGKPRGGVSG